MDILALSFDIFSLLSAVSCLILSVFVLSKNRRNRLNRGFFEVIILGFWYSFSSVMMWLASNATDAFYWEKASSIWPFLVVAFFHFALTFTQHNWFKKKIINILVYLPAFFFFLIDLTTNQIYSEPYLNYWGYTAYNSPTIIGLFSTIWSAILPIFAFILCFQYYRKSTEPISKKQSRLMTIGFGIPVFLFTLTTNGLNDVPNLGIISTFLSAIFFGYAILKYELFNVNAAVAAEEILMTIPDSLLLTDSKANIIRINERLVEFTGYSEKELIGKPLCTLLENKEECVHIVEKLLRNNQLRGIELIILAKNGDRKEILFSGSVIKRNKDNNIGLTCVFHDITDRRRTARLVTIGEIAAMVGHDLRNPLSGIKNAAFFLRKRNGSNLDDESLEMLNVIDRAILYSDKIINDLLDFSRDFHLELEQSSPKVILAYSLLGIKIPDNVSVCEIIEDANLYFDTNKMQRVFTNLIKNAFEAMPNGGRLNISGYKDKNNFMMRFSDTGVGISKDVAERLFMPLITTKAQGMGFGLAICKRIVEAHGGSISVESFIGQGTTFNISLPIEK
jgi:PAS domain S-box-containing protein